MNPSYEFENPFLVKRLGDLISLAGIWVAMIVLGQLAMSFYLAKPVGKFLDLPWLHVGCSLAVAYLALDAAVYLCLRGRMIFQWLVPAMCLAGTVMVPGLITYMVQSMHVI
jgi:hypothetical protein